MKTIFKIALLSLLLAAPTAVTVEAQARLCTNGNCNSGKNEKAKTVRITRTPSSKSVSSNKGKPASTAIANKPGGRGIRKDRYSHTDKKTLSRAAKNAPAGTTKSGSQIKQNFVAAQFGLSSLVNESGRDQFIRDYSLFKLEPNDILKIKLERPLLKEGYLYKFSAQFFYDLGRVVQDEFGVPVTLTSIWRSEAVQDKLRSNSKARSRGLTASSHPLATTADIGNKSNSKLTRLLLLRLARPLEAFKTRYTKEDGTLLGVVEILPESSCVHVMVYPTYDKITRASIQKIMRDEARKLRAEMGAAKSKRSKRR